MILTTAVLFCLPGAPSAPGCLAASGRQARLRQAAAGAPSAPGCLAASGRQARLRQAAAGAPASLRRTRWRGFGLPLRSDA
ncbi:hypothetical protein [Escherichia coli]|uniref:hypothetical protein n=1 Tax=Escherichia coli TaxID=562 RepID=UPI001FF29FAC|nr:hypothetical protein [Escherichia coli]